MDATDAAVIPRSSARLRELWSRDLPAFGLWSSSRDTVVAELVAGAPHDYVCVDLQHGSATFGELPGMLQAMRAAGRAPMVRVRGDAAGRAGGGWGADGAGAVERAGRDHAGAGHRRDRRHRAHGRQRRG